MWCWAKKQQLLLWYVNQFPLFSAHFSLYVKHSLFSHFSLYVKQVFPSQVISSHLSSGAKQFLTSILTQVLNKFNDHDISSHEHPTSHPSFLTHCLVRLPNLYLWSQLGNLTRLLTDSPSNSRQQCLHLSWPPWGDGRKWSKPRTCHRFWIIFCFVFVYNF